MASRFILDRGVRKAVKACMYCKRDMVWRKKWERCWDQVQFCSKRCKTEGRKLIRQQQHQELEQVPAPSILGHAAGLLLEEQLGAAGAAGGAGDLNYNVSELPANGPGGAPAAPVSKREARKARKKAARHSAAAAAPEGDEDAAAAGRARGDKACDVCGRWVDMCIRCRIDETKKWKMVCGKCWKSVSGGVTDGDAAHPHYQYGGLWRNRRA